MSNKGKIQRIARQRAKRVENEARQIAAELGVYFPIKGLDWRKIGKDTGVVDQAGADYWPYAWGVSAPVEAKSTTIDFALWQSPRLPYIFHKRNISDKQVAQMEKNFGYLYLVVFFVNGAKTGRARVLGRWFAPWSVWKQYMADVGGWRRPGLEAMREDGWGLTFQDGRAVPTENVVSFARDIAQRALAASAHSNAKIAFADALECYNEGVNASYTMASMALRALAAIDNLYPQPRIIVREAKRILREAEEVYNGQCNHDNRD